MSGPSDVVARARPESLREARDAVAGGGALLFSGGGTKLGWGGVPQRTELRVETGGLDALLRHDAGDMTATVGAGMPLVRLQEALAGAGQWLAVDPPAVGDGATVGGVLAADDYGPRRLRYGKMRDNVIGMTVVLSDGTVARTGGNVIKNVAGYDLAKLLCGSLGTLGLVAEVVVRLHPLPEASASLRFEADAWQATAVALDLMASPVEPSAVDWAGQPGGVEAGGGSAAGSGSPRGALFVRVEGHGRGVEARRRQVEALAAAHGLDAQRLDGDEEADAWRGLVEASAGTDGETVAATSTLPSELGRVAGSLAAAAEVTGVGATLHSHAALGTHIARLAPGDPAAQAATVAEWRRRLRPLGATVALRRRPSEVDAHIDCWGLDPSGALAATVPLMRAVKLRLDPAGRCAPGRGLGGM